MAPQRIEEPEELKTGVKVLWHFLWTVCFGLSHYALIYGYILNP